MSEQKLTLKQATERIALAEKFAVGLKKTTEKGNVMPAPLLIAAIDNIIDALRGK